MAAVISLWQLEEGQQCRGRFFAAVDDVHQLHHKVKPDIIERDVEVALHAVRTTTRRKG
jgi:hypothetical protein